jgi:hypothetical protein
VLDAGPLLDLREEHVERLHLGGRLHLREHELVEPLPRAFDDFDDVAVRPLGGQVVDADGADLALVPSLVQRRHHVLARLGLDERGARVLQVEEHLVGRERLGLLQEARVAARDGKTGAAGTQLADLAHAGILSTDD